MNKETFTDSQQCPACNHRSEFLVFEVSDTECDKDGYIRRYVKRYRCLNCLTVFDYGLVSIKVK